MKNYAKVLLQPKKDRSLRLFHPWVFSGAIAKVIGDPKEGEIVEVFSPDGKKISEIKTPHATNLCFGRGQFSKTLFIAGGKSIYSIETKNEGYNIPFKQ